MVTQEFIADFVNTLHEGEEALATPSDLGRWVVEHGLASKQPRVTADDVAETKEVREALRTLLLANNDVPVDVAGASAVLDGAARRARVELRFIDGAPMLAAEAAGVPGVVGQILSTVQAMTVDGTWGRLKACRARDCEWAFVDTAKNQSRAWCSMRSCGNREKARVFRERRRPAAA